VLPTPEFVAGIQHPVPPPQAAATPQVTPPTTVAQKPIIYESGDRVDAVLLSERTKKGGWKATIKGTTLTGPIQGTPPPDAEVDKIVLPWPGRRSTSRITEVVGPFSRGSENRAGPRLARFYGPAARRTHDTIV
jgi:hypothetical protein